MTSETPVSRHSLAIICSFAPQVSDPLMNCLCLSVLKPLVTVGGMTLQADGVDTVAGFAGVFDIRVKLPAGVPTGSDVPVTLELPGRDGAASNTVSIAIETIRR